MNKQKMGSQGGEPPSFSEFANGIEKAGPLHLVRGLCRYGRDKGALTVSYHVAPRFQAYGSSSHTFYATRNALSRRISSEEVRQAVGICHERVLALAKPVSLRSLIPLFMQEDPETTTRIMSQVHELGVVDEFMVPVYGPYNVNGVISFGFDSECDDIQPVDRFRIESICTSIHQRLVRIFINSNTEKELSPREIEVLSWIARGKTRLEISTILELRPASVDTYTRRIFKKLGVNDRVSAALIAVFEGVLEP